VRAEGPNSPHQRLKGHWRYPRTPWGPHCTSFDHPRYPSESYDI
jgi:hypothetical protein